MGLIIKPAESTDLELLFELNKSLIEQYEDLSSIDLPAVLAWVKRKLINKLGEYRAVFVSGEKVGYFRLCDGDEGTLEIDDLYVLVPYRGQGIGREIVHHSIGESERLQKPLMLYVFSQNTGAVRLYEQMGFTTASVVSPTRVIMRREPRSAQ